ncbi:MAG: Vitamin B12 import ATP-binding protein BtuD [Legionellaceae bacterium]
MAHILLDSVSVEFPVYHVDARSIKKQLINFSTGGKLLKSSHHSFIVKAIDDMTLTLHDNDSVGVIGCNGSGKSTLLRLLAGIYVPQSGKMDVQGKISSILDMNLGLNPEATGYENIIMRGILLGFTKREMLERLDEIAEFTELGDYLIAPVRTYSTGMMLRLAFGVVTSVQPEILLLDEVVGTGDAHFMEKAKERLTQLIKSSNIVVLSSHAIEIIQELCNKVLIMHKGKVMFFGSTEEGIDYYRKETFNN